MTRPCWCAARTATGISSMSPDPRRPRRSGARGPHDGHAAGVGRTLFRHRRDRGEAVSAAEITVPHRRPTEGDVAVRTHIWRPAAWRPADPVLIVLHGYRRNAADYRDVWAEHAERHRVLVAAPRVRPRGNFPVRANMRSATCARPTGAPSCRRRTGASAWSRAPSTPHAPGAARRRSAIFSTAIPPAGSSSTAWRCSSPRRASRLRSPQMPAPTPCRARKSAIPTGSPATGWATTRWPRRSPSG